MNNEGIVCFAKDWSEDPTSNNHIMKLLARDHKVLWLNSISTRRPELSSGHDLRKIWRKLCDFGRGAEELAPNLWVVTPIVLPLPHSRLAGVINRWILSLTIGYHRRKLGMREFELWTFLPSAVEYAGRLGESLVVYYCTDAWGHFSRVDGKKMAIAEERLLRRADVCFATSHALLEKKKALNPHTYLAPHGVDRCHFASALMLDTVVPADIAALPRPVVGFFGLIDERVDTSLVEFVARARPRWSIVLIGKAVVDTRRLRSLPNVHLLGRRAYSDLPAYCRGFDAGIIPYVAGELTRNINPIKLREYLSAGLPTVSTALPDVQFYRDYASIAENHDEFL